MRLVRRERQKREFELDIVSKRNVPASNLIVTTLYKLHPPERIHLSPIDSPLSLINRSGAAMQHPLDPFSLKDLKSVAPGIREEDITTGRDTTSRITTNSDEGKAFVHCECALAIAMKDRILGTMEIGISKDCCWPCLEFLARYSKKRGKIVMSATHGKTYHSWLFPATVPLEIHDEMEKSAQQEFSRWLLALNNRRTSDSHADSSDIGESSEPEGDHSYKILGESLKNTYNPRESIS